MFFKHPFFRHGACDLVEHMMTRNMLRNERIMRNELLRAMNTFEALEQEALQRYNHRDHRGHHEHRDHHYRQQRQVKAEEKEAQNAKPKEAETLAKNPYKAQGSETTSMKGRETERRQAQESRELRPRHERRDVFSEWNNSFDEFFRDVSPFGRHRSSVFDDFYRPGFDFVGRYAEEMRADMDRHFKSLEKPEAKEEYPTLKDPENTSYFMRVETNDNGHVRVKTVKKAPGTAWETKFEEYKKEKSAAVEKDSGSQNKQSIEAKDSKEAPKENLEAKQNKEETVKIAEEPQKFSESVKSVSA